MSLHGGERPQVYKERVNMIRMNYQCHDAFLIKVPMRCQFELSRLGFHPHLLVCSLIIDHAYSTIRHFLGSETLFLGSAPYASHVFLWRMLSPTVSYVETQYAVIPDIPEGIGPSSMRYPCSGVTQIIVHPISLTVSRHHLAGDILPRLLIQGRLESGWTLLYGPFGAIGANLGIVILGLFLLMFNDIPSGYKGQVFSIIYLTKLICPEVN